MFNSRCFVTKEAVANNTEMTINLSVAGIKSSTTKLSPSEEENNKENNIPEGKQHSDTDKRNDDEENESNSHIIPWRAQLRKTNSKLNLLE